MRRRIRVLSIAYMLRDVLSCLAAQRMGLAREVKEKLR